jgi:hypothetical protein
MPRIVRVVTADEMVEFESTEIVVRHTQEGVKLTPSNIGDNALGFTVLFFPWGEVRQIKEFDRA